MTIINIEGLDNVRDLGGIPAENGFMVKPHLIYRGDRVDNATEAGRNQLRKLGIKNVYDLRDPVQAGKYPDPPIEGINMHLTPAEIYTEYENSMPLEGLPLQSEEDMKKRIELHEKHYTTITRNPTAIKTIMHSMLSGGAPVYFHCTAGKDRTGVTAAIILLALGVSREDIISDYMLSLECRRASTDRRLKALYGGRPNGTLGQLISCYFDVNTKWIMPVFDIIDNEFGGIDAYLEKAIGFDASDRKQFKEMFLEKI